MTWSNVDDLAHDYAKPRARWFVEGSGLPLAEWLRDRAELPIDGPEADD